MKKLLIIPALAVAALTLTGCGGSGGTHSPVSPATANAVTPAPTPTVPAVDKRFLADVGGDNTLYEVTGKNSEGVPYRCYITETYQGVSQTCFEYRTVP